VTQQIGERPCGLTQNTLPARTGPGCPGARSIEVDLTSNVNRPLKHGFKECDWFNLDQTHSNAVCLPHRSV
jgi:hypothetical protein